MNPNKWIGIKNFCCVRNAGDGYEIRLGPIGLWTHLERVETSRAIAGVSGEFSIDPGKDNTAAWFQIQIRSIEFTVSLDDPKEFEPGEDDNGWQHN
jgi:hypothetical protein